jgi:hypothetical protein
MNNIRRIHLIIAAIIIFVMMGVIMLLMRAGTGTLEISAPDKTPKNAAVAVEIRRDGAEEQSFTLQPGETKKIRIKAGTVRVDGWADTLKAVDIVTIKGFSTTKLTTPTGEQRAAEQLASEATYCPVIVAGKTYSYGCEGEGTVTYHQSNKLGASLNTALFEGLSFSSMKPYKNGLIGFYATAGTATNLQYINLETRQITQVSLPGNVQKLMNTDQPEIATTSDPSGTRFGLAFTADNKLFVFDDITDTSPVEIKPGEGTRTDEDGRRARLSFRGDETVLFMGISTDTHEGELVTDTNPASSTEDLPDLDSFMFEYNTSGSLTRTTKIPEGVDVNGIYKLNNDFYAAEQAQGFSFYHREGDELVHTYTIDDMGSWTMDGDKAYVESGGTLYEFTPGKDGLFSLHSLFSSSEIRVSTIFTGPDGVIFTGLTSKASDAPLTIYKLLAKGEKGTNVASGSDNQDDTPTAPIIRGIDDILYYGISSFQADNLSFALSNYVSTREVPIASLEINNFDPVPHDRFSESTTDIIRFDVIVDGEDSLRGRLEYADLSVIRLYLTDKKTGAQVYDSQVINHRETPTYNPEPQH